MTPTKKNKFKNGIWVKKWKFRSDKSPFNSKMTPSVILSTKNKIVKFALKRLKDKKAWKAINVPFSPLKIIPKWSATGNTRLLLYHLTLQILDPSGPPGSTVVAPPPPRQPPPPIIL
jgi:hypothetical protein